MKFYTQYERPSLDECPHETHLDEGLVEVAGYRTTEELVMQLIQAGENLQAYREAEYEADQEIPDDAPAFKAMSRLDAELAMRRHIQSMKERMNERIGHDSGSGANSDRLGNELVQPAAAGEGKSAELGLDEAKLGKG